MTRNPPPEHTADGHYVLIDGRRWRATDPDLPADAAARLRAHLMAARRAVGAALRAHDEDAEHEARSRVQTAKVALGERGTPWWEQTDAERHARWTDGLAALDAEGGAPPPGLHPPTGLR
ncbi:hypothetical protein [Streptomyces subrutilus]|uniref:Biopolymer transporter Tol n=1 Tax=Streptomyces subrutilus TaxID=36818 RepID=A0A1E5PLC3_9ACTN|nr:hypothetical protein [Streptomyces subrutilus]OEJ30347.1 hypothetical protein BGK67_02335 [Streptomyces subrutilus]